MANGSRPPVDSRVNRIEMRTKTRYRILQRCFVETPNFAGANAWRGIGYNISKIGIGITLPAKLPRGTLLTIHAHGLQRARVLQARVVHAKHVEFVWFSGCEFITPLTDAELQVWQSGPRDWLDEHNQR